MRFSPSSKVRDPSAPRRWFLVHERGLVGRRGDGDALVTPTDADLGALGVDPAGAHALGRLDDAEAFALPFEGDPKALPAPWETFGLRALAMHLAPELFPVAGRAFHVVDWATTSRFCGRCGERTVVAEDERCAKCPRCALSTYPRIAPAVIVLVRKGREALLANSVRFPGVFYSTLAGFSEIGESLEETLVREVKEEVGIDVTNVRYFGSQPWPFPHSLMVGFTADWAGGDIVVDPTELTEAKWFSADALPNIPPPLSIARQLIDAWVTEITGKPA